MAEEQGMRTSYYCLHRSEEVSYQISFFSRMELRFGYETIPKSDLCCDYIMFIFRGLIPIILLQHLERVSGLKAHDMFDYVAGTSTGSILACELIHLSSYQHMYVSIY